MRQTPGARVVAIAAVGRPVDSTGVCVDESKVAVAGTDCGTGTHAEVSLCN